jgi:hypothetical protein
MERRDGKDKRMDEREVAESESGIGGLQNDHRKGSTFNHPCHSTLIISYSYR